MKVLWGIAVALVAIVTVILASSLQMRIRYSLMGANNDFSIELKALFGLVRYRYAVPAVRLKGLFRLMLLTEQGGTAVPDRDRAMTVTKETVERYFRLSRKMMAFTSGFTDWMKGTLSRVTCNELNWRTRIGLGDAPDTAIASGIAWGLKTTALAFLFRNVNLKTKPTIRVEPLFNRTLFSTELSCILKIRAVHAIIAGMLLLFRILKVKGGLKTWRNILFRA